jgi:hypothetical protein
MKPLNEEDRMNNGVFKIQIPDTTNYDTLRKLHHGFKAGDKIVTKPGIQHNCPLFPVDSVFEVTKVDGEFIHFKTGRYYGVSSARNFMKTPHDN